MDEWYVHFNHVVVEEDRKVGTFIFGFVCHFLCRYRLRNVAVRVVVGIAAIADQADIVKFVVQHFVNQIIDELHRIIMIAGAKVCKSVTGPGQ